MPSSMGWCVHQVPCCREFQWQRSHHLCWHLLPAMRREYCKAHFKLLSPTWRTLPCLVKGLNVPQASRFHLLLDHVVWEPGPLHHGKPKTYPNDSIIRSIIVVMILFIWSTGCTERGSHSANSTCLSPGFSRASPPRSVASDNTRCLTSPPTWGSSN